MLCTVHNLSIARHHHADIEAECRQRGGEGGGNVSEPASLDQGVEFGRDEQDAHSLSLIIPDRNPAMIPNRPAKHAIAPSMVFKGRDEGLFSHIASFRGGSR